MSSFMPVERSTLTSPAWFIPFDDHNRRVRSAGVTVHLDRHDNGVWVPQDATPVRTPSGALAFPGLGKRAQPGTAQPQRHRARFAAAGYQPLYPAEDQPFSADLIGVEFLVHPHNDTNPPAVRAEPRLVRLLPAVSFSYSPGTRTVRGVVVDATTKAPVGNALVAARGLTFHDRTPWQERTLSDATGAFRLALRWDGERAGGEAVEETFRLSAVQRSNRTGTVLVRLPQDAGIRHVIEISEQ
nr:carboxypeptidase-like regulatory domain-containing protein [Kibdelosporangium sp. MJ126-NF4]CEL16472.1 FIG01120916: hypothetical protein [Kibdelosporangium sp. MJ126-NF4]CTQ90424.1 FIG01120916: hypothetical protein [Kibdelosporangium sp. MJ126-NF4]